MRIEQYPRSQQPGPPAVVWITGAAGLIGGYLVKAAPLVLFNNRPVRIRALTRDDIDLLDFETVRGAFRSDCPSLVIHCAAMAQISACEKDPTLARRTNVEATGQLAELAAEIPFVFFSTDLVFDGRKGNYIETDSVNPLSVYAETKAEAEAIVLSNPGHTVVRTSLNAGRSRGGNRGFNEQLRRAFERGETLRLFTDEFRSPIHAGVTARAVWELVNGNVSGLYHVAGSERLSRWEIGQLLARRWAHLHPRIEPESIRNFQGAPRPPDTSLDCAKAQARLSFRLPGFSESIPDKDL